MTLMERMMMVMIKEKTNESGRTGKSILSLYFSTIYCEFISLTTATLSLARSLALSLNFNTNILTTLCKYLYHLSSRSIIESHIRNEHVIASGIGFQNIKSSPSHGQTMAVLYLIVSERCEEIKASHSNRQY